MNEKKVKTLTFDFSFLSLARSLLGMQLWRWDITYVRGVDWTQSGHYSGQASPRTSGQHRKGKERGKDVGRFPPWWGERKTPFSWSESAIFVRRVGQFRLRWAFIRDTKFCISQLDWRCLKKVRHYWEIHGFTVLLRVDTTIMSAAARSVSLA